MASSHQADETRRRRLRWRARRGLLENDLIFERFFDRYEESLSDDDVYALTAYVLYLNDIVAEEGFALSQENFTSIRMPNEDGFIDDNRASEPHYAGKAEPCMKDCKPGTARITMHAAVLDVTPDSERGEEAPAAGIE